MYECSTGVTLAAFYVYATFNLRGEQNYNQAQNSQCLTVSFSPTLALKPAP